MLCFTQYDKRRGPSITVPFVEGKNQSGDKESAQRKAVCAFKAIQIYKNARNIKRQGFRNLSVCIFKVIKMRPI